MALHPKQAVGWLWSQREMEHWQQWEGLCCISPERAAENPPTFSSSIKCLVDLAYFHFQGLIFPQLFWREKPWSLGSVSAVDLSVQTERGVRRAQSSDPHQQKAWGRVRCFVQTVLSWSSLYSICWGNLILPCLCCCHRVQVSPHPALGVDVGLTRGPLNQRQNTTERGWLRGDLRKILITNY